MSRNNAVLLDVTDGLATITLNRPEKLNALTPDMFEALDEYATSLARRSDEVGLVVLKGDLRAFSAGNDLRALSDRGPHQGSVRPVEAETIDRIAALPQLVIAAVRGYCLTGGLELALAADFIVASESARFGDTHARWGLSPKWGLSQRLPRRVGYPRAIELMTSTGLINGRAAAEIGLVNHCWPDDDFDERLMLLASDILKASWHSVQGAKRLLAETHELLLADGLQHEIAHSPGASADSAERIASYKK